MLKCEGFKKTGSLQPTTARSQRQKNIAQRDYVAHADPQQQVLDLLPFMLALHSRLSAVSWMRGHSETARDKRATASVAKGVQKLGHWMEPQSSRLERRKKKLLL